MGVKYQVHLTSGISIPMHGACFGSMNRIKDLSHYMDRQTVYKDGKASATAKAAVNTLFATGNRTYSHKIRFFSFDCDDRDRNQFGEWGRDWAAGQTKYLKEMRALFQELPMFRDIVHVRPVLERIDFKVKGQPADKVMLAMFLARNLANYANPPRLYQDLRAQGLNRRASALLASLYSYDDRNLGHVQRQGHNESSVFDPESFGLQAFVNFMNQTEDSVQWVQGTFAEQHNGYMRQSHYKKANITFDVTSRFHIPDDVDEDGEWFDPEAYAKGPLYFGALSRSLCVQGDTPLPFQKKRNLERDFQNQYPGRRWYLLLRNLLGELETVLQAQGVTLYEER